jgi:fumarylacetoacetate (FAA) hydrolase
MKLATYRDGSRDGQLVVVSRDLGLAQYATHIANRLQQVLDDWNYLSPQLQDVYDTLNAGRSRNAFPFDPAQCMAPLPRAFQRADCAAYPSHTELLCKAAGAELPANLHTEPLMAQGTGDALLGPNDPIVVASEALGIDFGAGLAVVTDDIPMGCPADRALEGVRLLMLANDITLRSLMSAAAANGQGPVQSKPATAFSPVAVTPEELGEAWSRGRVHLALQCTWNGRKVGLCDAGSDMAFHFGQLIAHLAKTRALRAGTLVSAGPVGNPGIEKKGAAAWPQGYSCIAEKRAIETLQDSQPATNYLQYGDTIRLDMKAANGHSVFGAIEQEVVAPKPVTRGRPPGSGQTAFAAVAAQTAATDTADSIHPDIADSTAEGPTP